MAESETTVRGGASDGGEGGVAARAMVGGSLPPRKRLLAGLKQNSLWLAASNQAAPPKVVHRPEGGTLEAGAVPEVRSATSAAVTGKADGGCLSCGALQSSAWRRVERNGVLHRLCNFCALLFNKNMKCPHCLVVYPDVRDPAIWMQCCGCQRSVHVECEKRCPSQVQACAYVCSDCVQLKKHKEHANALLGTASIGCIGSLGMSCDVGGGNCASSAAAECSSPCSKKPRVSREARSKSSEDVEADDAGIFDGMHNSTKVGVARKGASSQEAAAATAAALAALAGRAAAKARASAAAKAAAAVKAAAAAKAALDAAALAARLEAQARVGLRRSSVSWERTVVGGDFKIGASFSQSRKERSEDPEVKIELEEIRAATSRSSVDDEQLARQLHRAINSSPRISSGLTPLRRKPSITLSPIVNASHSVISWSRVGLSSAGEARSQSKQQQTRPRSIYQKEGKRIDSRVVKLESKMAGENPPRQPACTVAAGNSMRLGVFKTEPADSSTVTLLRQDSETTLREHGTSVPLKGTLKTENDHVNGAAPQVFFGIGDNQDNNQDGRRSVANVSKVALILDEVFMSEVDTPAEERCSPRLRGGSSPHLKEDLSASTSLISEGAVSRVHAQGGEEDERPSAEGGGMVYVTMSSGVAALSQVASTAMDLLVNQDSSADASIMEGQCQWIVGGDGDSAKDLRASGTFCQLTGEASSSIPGEHSKGASDFENVSAYGSSSHRSAHGQQWEQGTFTGMPDGGQGFASSVHITSSSSAPS